MVGDAFVHDVGIGGGGEVAGSAAVGYAFGM